MGDYYLKRKTKFKDKDVYFANAEDGCIAMTYDLDLVTRFYSKDAAIGAVTILGQIDESYKWRIMEDDE